MCLPPRWTPHFALTYMDTIGKSKDDAPSASQEPEPRRNQFLRNWGRTLSPRIEDRVVIYDCEKRSVQVRSQKEVDKGT